MMSSTVQEKTGSSSLRGGHGCCRCLQAHHPSGERLQMKRDDEDGEMKNDGGDEKTRQMKGEDGGEKSHH